MKKLLILFCIILSTNTNAQTYRLTNEAWNCGTGYNPKVVSVVNGRIYFDWNQNGVWSWKTLKAAKEFWKREETTVTVIKK